MPPGTAIGDPHAPRADDRGAKGAGGFPAGVRGLSRQPLISAILDRQSSRNDPAGSFLAKRPTNGAWFSAQALATLRRALRLHRPRAPPHGRLGRQRLEPPRGVFVPRVDRLLE